MVKFNSIFLKELKNQNSSKNRIISKSFPKLNISSFFIKRNFQNLVKFNFSQKIKKSKFLKKQDPIPNPFQNSIAYFLKKNFSKFGKFQLNFSQRIKESKFVKKRDYFHILSKIKCLPLFHDRKKIFKI